MMAHFRIIFGKIQTSLLIITPFPDRTVFAFANLLTATISKSSRPEVFCKSVEISPCIFIYKETLAQVFSCEFCEIFKNAFFTRHLR